MRKQLIILGSIVVLAILLPFVVTDGFFLDTVITALIFATFATAWNIAGGLTGLFSLGHGGIFAVGAYTPILLLTHYDVPIIVGMLLGGIFAAIAALLLGLLSLRLKGHYFSLATLAFTVIVSIILVNAKEITGGDEGISLPFTGGPASLVFDSKEPYVYLTLGLYVVTALTVIFILRSRLGYRMRAVREDEVTARSVGVPALRTKLIAAVLSGFFSGLAGAMMAQYTLYITPSNTAAVPVSLQPALMAIIGGMLGVFGPLIGAVIITFLEQQLITIFGADIPGLSNAVFGGLLLISILFLPNGIIGLFTGRNGRRFRSLVGRRSKRNGPASVQEPAEVKS